MESWEQELREALRRQDAPAGFAARLQRRIADESSRQPWWRHWAWSPRWAMALALCLLLIAGGVLYRRRQMQERLAGARAKQEVMLALRITHAKMQLVAERVQKVAER